MNIKSLLIGSAAATVAATGAQAADAIFVPEPEPMEYVRVCDVYGAGFFYIPGTETCLKISGYVRFETRYDSVDYDDEFVADGDFSTSNFWTRAHVNLTAKNETEYGTLTSYIALNGESGEAVRGDEYWETDDLEWYTTDSGGDFYLDEAYLELGGFRAGYFNHWLDAGIAGETDSQGFNAKFDSVRYTADFNGFSAGVSIDEPNGFLHVDGAGVDEAVLGVSGMVSGNFGPVFAELVGYYDVGADEGGVRLRATADVGPGTLGGLAIWNSGDNGYQQQRTFNGVNEGSVLEHLYAVSYALNFGKATITPGFQWAEYVEDEGMPWEEDVQEWRAGVALGYKITEGLDTLVSLQYIDHDDDDLIGEDGDYNSWDFFWRLQRNF